MQINFSIETIESFILVMSRVGGIIFSAPILGSRAVPVMAKAGTTLFLAFSFLPLADFSATVLPVDSVGFTFALISELMIGIVLGLIAQIANVAVQFGGHTVGIHMGFRVANVFDPTSEETASVTGAFLNIIVVLLMLAMNFHLVIVQVVKESYTRLPPLGASFNLGIGGLIVGLGSIIYVWSVQVVFPVLAAIFFIEVIIAILAKTAPRFNMLMLQFPIKIGVGLIFFIVLVRGFPESVKYMLTKILELMGKAIGFMGM